MTSLFSAGYSSDHPCIESIQCTFNTWVVWSENCGHLPKMMTSFMNSPLLQKPIPCKMERWRPCSKISLHMVQIIQSLLLRDIEFIFVIHSSERFAGSELRIFLEIGKKIKKGGWWCVIVRGNQWQRAELSRLNGDPWPRNNFHLTHSKLTTINIHYFLNAYFTMLWSQITYEK